MGDVISARKVGIVVSLEDNAIADKIWGYYQNINWINFEINCTSALDIVLGEQQTVKEQLLQFVGQ